MRIWPSPIRVALLSLALLPAALGGWESAGQSVDTQSQRLYTQSARFVADVQLLYALHTAFWSAPPAPKPAAAPAESSQPKESLCTVSEGPVDCAQVPASPLCRS